jgi:hypothetical protein
LLVGVLVATPEARLVVEVEVEVVVIESALYQLLQAMFIL